LVDAAINSSVDSVAEGLEPESGAFRFGFTAPFPRSLGFFSSELVFEFVVLALAFYHIHLRMLSLRLLKSGMREVVIG
jgi:hypothetical protein